MKKSLLALTLLAALPFAASAADGVSYNYVEGGYIANDALDSDGWAINGSGAIAPNFHVFGGYSGQKTDDFNVGGVRFEGVDVDQMRLGLGYNHEISPRADLLTRVAYERSEDEFDNTFDGYSVEAGVRGAMTPMLEGYALAGYEDGDEFDLPVFRVCSCHRGGRVALRADGGGRRSPARSRAGRSSARRPG